MGSGKEGKPKRARLDDLLVAQGFAESRGQAQALILAGSVLVDDRVADKAGTPVFESARIRVRGDHNPYVSRGGLKLRGALEAFGLDVRNLIALDVGASTGGFTDCLLQAGAARVYALDVAYGQLAWKLREDPRVVCIERTNIRHYEGTDLVNATDIAVIDTSFISLIQVIPPVLRLLRGGAILLALVKPQFEVKKEEVGENGVVRDPLLHERVLAEIEQFCRGLGLDFLGNCASPLTGPAGNREFFICARKPPGGGGPGANGWA